jgi:protein O-GlcNAc transferase
MSDVEQAKVLFFEALDLLDAKHYAAAETRLRDALRIAPDRVSALTNLAVALLEQEKLDEAADVATRSVTLDPDNAAGWLALGTSLRRLGRLEEALAAMDRMVVLAAGDPKGWMGRASVFAELKTFDRAIADYELAMALNPNEEDLRGLLVSARMHACDWPELEAETADLLANISSGKGGSHPFTLLALPSTAADQLACAAQFTARHYPALPPLYRGERYDHARIRIAYVSGDFREHPVADVMAAVFEHHDRARFEMFGVSHGVDDGSPLRARVAQSFDQFIDVHDKHDIDVATLLYAHQIDVAVDLGGLTAGGRPSIFAMRPTPVQVSFLGYPGTSGSSTIDYLVADKIVIPADQRGHYSEKIVWLPDAYLPNDDKHLSSETPQRKAVGLPERGFVFCSFSDAYKITPIIFDVWMRLLRDVEDSVLWLRQVNEIATTNLRGAAVARGVAPDRLIFAPKLPMDDHLARLRLAGIFLDTPHYNAHSTAADALWAGLPVVTCTGATFTSRVATSLLHAIDLPELATRSLEEYAALALRLAQEPATLAAIKAKLSANRGTTPLFDTARFTRHLEAAFVGMVARHRGGEAPEAFAVQPMT